MRVHYRIQPDWVLIIMMVLFIICAECSGQTRTHRYTTDSNVVTITPDMPMKFNAGRNDTIFLSIFADSLSEGYCFSIFMYFPKRIDIREYTLDIGIGGKTLTFESGLTIIENNYSNYIIDPIALKWLKSSHIECK